MIDELQLFRGHDYVINEFITIHHPTLNEICDYGEKKYYSMVSNLCATPSDYKVFLFDNYGIYYEDISEFEFFCTLSRGFLVDETSILFGDLDFSCFDLAKNTQNGQMVLYDSIHNIIIDEALYKIITDYLRHIHNFEKRNDIAGNDHTKKYLIEKERRQQKRKKNEKYRSMLVPLVSAMVNCEQFKYDHNTVWNLPIYVFMDSVKRIQKLKNYNQLMQGVYAGTIDSKTLSQDSFDWMGSLSKN